MDRNSIVLLEDNINVSLALPLILYTLYMFIFQSEIESKYRDISEETGVRPLAERNGRGTARQRESGENQWIPVSVKIIGVVKMMITLS